MNTYLTIPSAGALTKKQAIEIFYERYTEFLDSRNGLNLDWEKLAQREIKGINYQADYGEHVYLDFCDFRDSADTRSDEVITVEFECLICASILSAPKYDRPLEYIGLKQEDIMLTAQVKKDYSTSIEGTCDRCKETYKRTYSANHRAVF